MHNRPVTTKKAGNSKNNRDINTLHGSCQRGKTKSKKGPQKATNKSLVPGITAYGT